ncbi:MAG: SsrA-binding protein SmpB [Planctomycetia bacterium]
MADKKTEPGIEKVICRNRKALHEYEIFDTIEAGIVLTGTEVKSLRAGKAHLEDAFASIDGDEIWLHKSEIPEYAMGNRMNHEPKRKRKLLLHRREISKFAGKASERGYTLIPLRVYFKSGKAKVEIAVAKGKQLHDKRDSIKDREVRREISKALGDRRNRRD